MDNASLKRHSRFPSWKAQALQTWDILIEQASRKEISYGDFSEILLDRRAPRACSMPLGIVLTFCREQKLPPLSVIVVNKKTKRPAEDAPYNVQTVRAEIEKVLKTDWKNFEMGVMRQKLESWLDEKYRT